MKILRRRRIFLLSLFSLKVLAQDESTTPPAESTSQISTTASPTTTPTSTNSPPTSTTSITSSSSSSSSMPSITKTTSSSAFDPSAPADVVLHVPELSVGRIELTVLKPRRQSRLPRHHQRRRPTLRPKINLTITDVHVTLDLVVRLGHLVDIVNRVFASLDLNPLLIDAINGVTDLLGSITQGGKTLSFLIDNLGHIVQCVTDGPDASPVNTIVGDYLTNMTFTGTEKKLANGLLQRTYEYPPLNLLVDIVFNAPFQAVVQKKNGGGGGGGASTRLGV